MKIDKMIKDEVTSDYTIAKAKMEVVRSVDDKEQDTLKDFTKEALRFTALVSSIRESIFTRMKHIQSKECAEQVLNMLYKIEGEENKLEDGVKDYTGKHISAKLITESISSILEDYEKFRNSIKYYGMILPEMHDETPTKPTTTAVAVTCDDGIGLPRGYSYIAGRCVPTNAFNYDNE
jgi:hypothetical protein